MTRLSRAHAALEHKPGGFLRLGTAKISPSCTTRNTTSTNGNQTVGAALWARLARMTKNLSSFPATKAPGAQP